MLILALTALAMSIAGGSAWGVLHWSGAQLAPRVPPRQIRAEVHRHPRLAAAISSRLDPASATGLAVTAAVAVVVACAVGFGLLLFMVRDNVGFARFDLGAARFAARHASPTSTAVLRAFAQLGGAVLLAPITIGVAVVAARRRRAVAVVGFLLLTVGGQFVVVNLIKAIVNRSRPDIDRLTGFSGQSFPSGHAAAAAAAFATFALVAGIGRSPRARAIIGGMAVAIAVGVACTRVFLGVHWLTDVLAGLAVGWAWFALCSVAVGGRLLRFGAPAEQVAAAVDEVAPTAAS